MRTRWLLLLLVTLVAGSMVSSCGPGLRQYYDNGVPDEVYVAIAQDTPEARALLGRYPQAEIWVDRSGKLAVDFRVTRRPITDTTQTWEGLRLRVFVDARTRRATGALVQCGDKFVKKDLVSYIERYAKTQSCP